MRFLVYYIRIPLSTLYFNAPPPPNQHPTPCSHIPPPMPRHSHPYAAYNLSPIPFSAFPCPASLLNHTPHPLIQPQYPRSLLFIPPHIRLSHILTPPPPILSLSKNACASLTHTPTHYSSTFSPIYTSFPCPVLKPTTQHNTTQLISLHL